MSIYSPMNHHNVSESVSKFYILCTLLQRLFSFFHLLNNHVLFIFRKLNVSQASKLADQLKEMLNKARYFEGILFYFIISVSLKRNDECCF